MKNLQELYHDALQLLSNLISKPSFSRHEDATATIIEAFFKERNIEFTRHKNNVWSRNKYFDDSKITILLNSHHDTVKPDSAYTNDPFYPKIENGKIYGLGSNDAGGALVSLIACFCYFYERSDLPVNLVIAGVAEEECSGINGVESLLKQLPACACAIVGEPTSLDVAIAEKGLMVLDCVAQGVAGHAAREEGENAIYKAVKDIEWFRSYRFERISETLGEVKMTVASIQTTNTAHNVVPSECRFVVDIRVTDMYSLDELLELIRQQVSCEVLPRSMRLKPSSISKDHNLVKAAANAGKSFYGSPTLSDQALLNMPSIKCGPGESARSHTADEFIYLNQVRDGIETYIRIIEEYFKLSETKR